MSGKFLYIVRVWLLPRELKREREREGALQRFEQTIEELKTKENTVDYCALWTNFLHFGFCNTYQTILFLECLSKNGDFCKITLSFLATHSKCLYTILVDLSHPIYDSLSIKFPCMVLSFSGSFCFILSVILMNSAPAVLLILIF